MVLTKKFSEFALAALDDPTNDIVGVGGGVNFKSPKILNWRTAGRPLTPINGLMGYNTDLSLYEYWDAVTSAWVQILSSNSGLDWITVTTSSITASSNN